LDECGFKSPEAETLATGKSVDETGATGTATSPHLFSS
jgi:hypothetical protein